MDNILIDSNYEKEFLLYDKKSREPIKIRANKTGKQWMTLCPKHNDTNPSLSINEKLGYYRCFGCGWSGKLYDPNFRNSASTRKEIAHYNYLDEKGNLLFQCVRYEPKDFRFRRPGNKGCWIYDLKNTATVPYKLPEIVSSNKDASIFIAEGEKAVDQLDTLGFIATTSPMGAGNWKEEYNDYFENRSVILVPDNDKQGKEHCVDIGNNLSGIAKEIRWLEIPGLDDKQDISDWLCQGNGKEELDILIDSAKPFKEVLQDNEIELMDKFDVQLYTDKTLSRYNLLYDEFKRFWIYEDYSGIWLVNAKDTINSVLRKYVLKKDHLKKYFVSEILEEIKGRVLCRNKVKEPEPRLIPFNDRIYDLKNDTLIDYSPNYFFINKIPVDIDTDNTECPVIDKLFTDWVGEKNKEVLYEIAAYCLYRAYPNQIFFILYGKGHNGKSTYCNILEKFLGQYNISSASLKELTRNRFATSQLYGRFLNICGEIDTTVLKDTSTLKQLTGEDLINCEKKFKNPFTFRNYAKIIITRNKVPESCDRTIGFMRRVSFVDFPNEFIRGENADSDIPSMIDDKELQGFAKQCILKLKKLDENKFEFSNSDSVENILKRYDDLSSPLNDYLKAYTEDDARGVITVGEFKDGLNVYLEDLKISPWSGHKINKTMHEKGYQQDINVNHSGIGDSDTIRVWTGLKWTF